MQHEKQAGDSGSMRIVLTECRDCQHPVTSRVIGKDREAITQSRPGLCSAAALRFVAFQLIPSFFQSPVSEPSAHRILSAGRKLHLRRARRVSRFRSCGSRPASSASKSSRQRGPSQYAESARTSSRTASSPSGQSSAIFRAVPIRLRRFSISVIRRILAALSGFSKLFTDNRSFLPGVRLQIHIRFRLCRGIGPRFSYIARDTSKR